MNQLLHITVEDNTQTHTHKQWHTRNTKQECAYWVMLARGTADSLTPLMTWMGTPPDNSLPFPAQRRTDNKSKANVTSMLRNDHRHTHTHTCAYLSVTHTHTHTKTCMMYVQGSRLHGNKPTYILALIYGASRHMLILYVQWMGKRVLIHTHTHMNIHSTLKESMTLSTHVSKEGHSTLHTIGHTDYILSHNACRKNMIKARVWAHSILRKDFMSKGRFFFLLNRKSGHKRDGLRHKHVKAKSMILFVKPRLSRVLLDKQKSFPSSCLKFTP